MVPPGLLLWTTILLVTGLAKANSDSDILASTLFTFRDYVCEDDRLKIHCPFGTTVSIQAAMYGRQVPSQDMCPAMVDALWTQNGTYQPKEEVVNCNASSSLPVVLDKCQDKRKCSVRANPTEFGEDPCPGTSKYLEVAYKCRPNEFRKRVACEGQDLALQCRKSQRIAIYSAVFGRDAAGSLECPSPGIDTECQVPCSLQVVMRECHGRRRCSVPATQNQFDLGLARFNNLCPPNTPKYLSIVYACVPKRILKEMRRHEDTGSPNSFCDEVAATTVKEDVPVEDELAGHREGRTTLIPPWAVLPPYEEGPPGREDEEIYNPPPSTWDYGGRHVENHDEPVPSSTNDPCAPGPDGEVSKDCMPAGPGASKEKDGYIGFINDWIGTVRFIEDNLEKFILYLLLGLMAGIIMLLLLVICRLVYTKRRHERQAKLEISEPIPNSSHKTEDFSLLDRSNSSNDGIEILSINQRGPPPYITAPDPSNYGGDGTGTYRNNARDEDLSGSDAYNNDYRNMSGTGTFRNDHRSNQAGGTGTGTFRGDNMGTFRHEGSPSTFRNNTGTFNRDQPGNTGTFRSEHGGGTGTFRSDSRLGRETTPLMEQVPPSTNGFHPEHVGGASTLPRSQPMTHDDVIAEIWSQPPPPNGSATMWSDNPNMPAPFPSDSNRSLNNNYYG